MAAEPQQSSVLPFEQARGVVESYARNVPGPGTSESVGLVDSVGRVLAEAVIADRDFPPFPRATRDGYGVRAADLATIPAKLKIIGEIKAGGTLASASGEGNLTLGSGEAAAIMTGAPAPVGADAVVMVEYTSREGSYVAVQRSVRVGENIVPAGSEARRGDVLLQPGHRVDYAGVALAASVGKEH
ncbi:MAG TPA: molybdopterin molybdenumtransferase MoeA, partial [Terriglobales bacterium]|nr:molybdopterin molybdenumtransferase MoeA [Terriglobales bacterium]